MNEKLLKNKYVFLDFDGTLCEYRYNDKVNARSVEPDFEYDWGQTFDELMFGDVFLKARPLKTMKKVIAKCDPNKVYILGAVTTINEINQKFAWLKENYPYIKKENMFFIADGVPKVLALQSFSKKYNISPKDIVFIDDTHAHIKKAEEAGFKAYHITSFID